MTVSCSLIVADNVQPPHGRPRSSPDASLVEYEPGHSERQATGFVTLAPDCRWSVTLAVPMTGDQSILLTLDREGPLVPAAPSVGQVGLIIPPGEVDAVLVLLQGVVAQARRDGVLARRSRKAPPPFVNREPPSPE